MYKIGELSKLCNISVKTLRYYDAEGLLVPDEIDQFTGYRYYSASKLADCYRIIALKELGFSLEEIKAQLTADSDEKIITSLSIKAEELTKLIASTEKQLKRIESLKNNLMQGEKKMFDIILRDTDDFRVAFTRKIYSGKDDAFEDIKQIASTLPRSIIGKRRILINYETEYKDENFDIAACVEIVGAIPKETEYSQKSITFDTSTLSLVCKRSELDDAYKAMIEHLDSSGLKICGAYYEIYHDDSTVELKVPVCEYTSENIFVTEDIGLPFVDDPEVCGKWEMLDILPTREHFVYGKPKCGHLAWLDELYFIDGGKEYWSVGGWTKGFLFTYGRAPQETLKNKYTIEEIDGHKLLFLEMKHYCDGDKLSGAAPEIWVYEKIENKRYKSKDDIRRVDNIDYPFISDSTVIGKWKARDFVINKEDFDPIKQNWPADDMFVFGAEFQDNGVYVSTSKNGTNSITSVWTKGLVLNKREKTASAYEIKIIDGVEYLFREWKTGDYIFGGGRAYWYIFTRA